ncbi:precorrin-6y C5,15-methyltransferase (decarboxylating) subunit CbiE [Ammonicoccus fulvus]|uniref:Precorrin-6y C5,15-methyltransferase (Decarboxylating) subunit CbiE n=1 Tax=Ammonicoccus fulvus TaxID=3138240 RepID=A0ABZ3FP57_9ACTN
MIAVVGMGADGPASCSVEGRRAIAEADIILGGRRHLDLVDGLARAEVIEWPSPLRAGLPGLLERYAGRRVVALASGDPLVAGIATTLIELLGPDRVVVHPAVSSVALARARLGWAADTCEVVRLGGRGPGGVDRVRRLLAPGRRVLVLSADETSPRAVARVCIDAGFPEAHLTILGHLGGETETRSSALATEVAEAEQDHPRLNIVAVECGVEKGPSSRPQAASSGRVGDAESVVEERGTSVSKPRPVSGLLAPGLPDEAFEHDGQLTKRHLRACALAVLQSTPGELLWDLGAGAGSIGIEWARLHRDNRVVAVERDSTRAERIVRNAARLGVPDLDVRTGAALALIDDLPDPDAIFVGGGASTELLDRCWARLGPHGRLVVHSVTLETEALLIERHAALGGELVQLAVATAQALGSYRGWSPARPVVQWAVLKEI